MNELWSVWLVHYAAYWEIERFGDHPPRQMTGPMTMQRAIAEAERCGFGYCAKPYVAGA